MKKLLIFLKNYWPTLCVVAVILYATLTADPLADVDLPLFPGADKLIHAIMFGGLAGAIAFDFQRIDCSYNRLPRVVMIVICTICAWASAIDEFAQATLTRERSGDVYDLFADVAGIVVAYYLAPPVVRKVLGVKGRS